MSQLDTLQAMDHTMIQAFKAAGLADAAVYSEGAKPEPCDALVDEGIAEFGPDVAGVAGRRTLVSLLIAQVPAPRRNATVTIPATGKVYVLEEMVSRDQSLTQWVVSHG